MKLITVFSIIAVLVFGVAVAAENLQKVTLMLEWYECQTHTVFLVADELGFYEDEDLDMTIIPPGQDCAAPIRNLLSGKIEFAYTEPSYFIGQVIENDFPLVAFGALLHSWAHVWYGFEEICAWRTPADLKGLRLLDTREWPGGKALTKLLELYGLEPDKDIEWVEAEWSIKPLMTKHLDVSQGYITNELYMLEKQGRDCGYLWAGDYFNAYGGLLITTKTFITEYPDLVKAFMRANNRAMDYIIDDPDSAAQIVSGRVAGLTFDEVLVPLRLMFKTVYYNPISEQVGDFTVYPERMLDTLRWLYFIGQIEDVIDPNELIAPGFVTGN